MRCPWPSCWSLVRTAVVGLAVCASALLFAFANEATLLAAVPLAGTQSENVSSEDDSANESNAGAVEPTNDVLTFSQSHEIEPADTFEIDIASRDLAKASERAWEYRPYRVAVWLCLDGSPQLASISEGLKADIEQLAATIEPSGWDVAVDAAPPKWRWSLLNGQVPATDDDDERTGKDDKAEDKLIGDEPLLEPFDKLMVVTLQLQDAATTARVRELDLTTDQWGPTLERSILQRDHLAASLTDMIRRAFMPLAQIDRVAEKEGVFMIARAIESCRETRQTAIDTFEMVANDQSPVLIRQSDRFLPVIRKLDRNGVLVGISPIDFTWLTINEINGPQVVCSVHSSQRAPLAGRQSKRAEKLALVIRPPEGPTMLTLVTGSKETEPLEGVEVWARKPNADKEEASDFIGKTNWQGEIAIQPNEDGLRVIFVKRGSRALMQLPIIPGLYDNLTAHLPDDQTRLYAEGVITGLSNQVVALVIQRQILEQDIEAALDTNDHETARQLMFDYSELESAQDVRTRMTDEEIRLKTLTTNSRELQYIRDMFQNLRDAVAKEASRSKESELQERFLQVTGETSESNAE